MRGLLPGNLQTTPGLGHRGSSRCGGRHRGTPAPGLQRRLQWPIRQNSKGNKSSEYLVYPRVLRPATKLLCMYRMERGRLYSGLQDRNTRIRGNMLGLSKTSIFRRCLAAWGKNQPTVYINININAAEVAAALNNNKLIINNNASEITSSTPLRGSKPGNNSLIVVVYSDKVQLQHKASCYRGHGYR